MSFWMLARIIVCIGIGWSINGIIMQIKRKAAIRQAAKRYFVQLLNSGQDNKTAVVKVQYQEGPAPQGGEEGEGHEAYTGNRVGY